MNRSTTRLVTAVAVAAALAIGVGASTRDQAAAQESPAPNVQKVVNFHRTMDRLWQDHVTWTRDVIISFVAGAPDLNPAVARLLRNQVDIGNAIKPYHGKAAGNKLTSLLQTHIKEALPVLTAAKVGDQPALNKALATWYANGHQIAAFLSKANPSAWPLHATKMMMDEHLKLTTDEAVARLKGNWRADIAAYDKVRSEILMMSGALADGIVAQFPARFS
jgi:hypothetical protein